MRRRIHGDMAPTTFKFLALVAATLCISAATASPYCPDGCQCVWLDIVCDNAGLTAVPSGDWSYVYDLFLSGNKITSLPAGAFAGYPKLTTIYLDGNGLTELDLDLFAKVSQLSDLRVASNAIATILPPKGDAQLTELSTLVLSSNQLKSLDPRVFDAAPYLRYLYLDGNPLSLPGSGPLLVHATVATLVLDSVDASALSALTLSGLPNLDTLSLNASGVPSLAGALTSATTLWTLTASGNDITTLAADAFAPGTHLDTLTLDDNPLETLDDSVKTVLRDGALLSIVDTPLACNCAYKSLLSWANRHSVRLNASCRNAPACSF